MPIHAERDIVMTNQSVCPSVTFWYCIETNAPILVLFPPSGRGMTSFLEAYRRYKFPRGTPSAGALYARRGKNRRLSLKRYEMGPWLLWITNRKS